MKWFKRFISIGAVWLMLLPCLCIYAEPDDSAAGYLYYTDVKTYIWSSLITSYNIGGKTVIDAEALTNYSFGVFWHEDTRRLEILSDCGHFSDAARKGELAEGADGEVGQPYCPYYKTDIVTTLDGKYIESYNVGGRTFIVAERMADMGYDVFWDEAKRRLLIVKMQKVTTDYGELRARQFRADNESFIKYEGGIKIKDSDGLVKEIKTPSNYTIGSDPMLSPYAAYVDSDGIRPNEYMLLSDMVDVLNADIEIVEQLFTQDIEFNSIYIDTYYSINLTYDENVKPATIPVREEPPRTDFEYKNAYIIFPELRVNGVERAFVWRNTIFDGLSKIACYVIDGKIYVCAYTLRKLLGYGYEDTWKLMEHSPQP